MKNDNHADEFRKVPTIKRSQGMVGGGAAFAPLYAPYNHCAHILVPHTAVTQGVKHERCTPGLLTETQHPSLKATLSKNTCWPKKLRICSSSSKHVHLHVLCGCSINIYATEVLSCLEFGSMDSSVVRLLGSWSKGSRIWVPAGESTSPGSTFCADSYFCINPPPPLPQKHIQDSSHSAKSAGGRLRLNTHAPYVNSFAWSDVTWAWL